MQNLFTILRKRILIIDDDADLLEILKDFLTDSGYEVKFSTKSDEAIRLVDQYQPDLVILDYLLHGINGGEICHQLKTNSQTKNIPVILFSAYPRVLLSLGTYGCDRFISKPFDLWDFSQEIRLLLEAGPEMPSFGFKNPFKPIPKKYHAI